MSNGPDSWSHTPVQESSDDGANRSLSSNSTCSSLVTERDYIGLSSSSSSSVGNFTSPSSDKKHVTKDFDLDSKDTELRLGLGPASAGQDSRNAAQSDGEKKSDCNVAEQQQPVSSSTANARKVCLERGDGNGSGISEKLAHSAANGGRLESFQAWNGEQHMLSQRGTLPPANAVDKKFFTSQERLGHDSQVVEVNHAAKDKPWSLPPPHAALHDLSYANREQATKIPHQNEILRHDAPHHLSSHGLTTKLPNSTLEVRCAPAPEKNSYDASAADKFWTYRLGELGAGDAGFNPPGGVLAPGRFVIPVPKVSTVPAKRPYFEAIGDSRTIYATESRNDPRANPEAEAKFQASQAPKIHTASGLFSWNNVIQLPPGWQMSAEQPKGVFGTMVPGNTALPPRPAQVPSQFKAPASAPPSNESAANDVVKAPSLAAKQDNSDSRNEDGGSRAPVVGWPPIRSFRKNTLAAHPKHNADDENGSPSTAEGSEQGKHVSTALYVKAKLDGVRICRKVDLKSYDSYASLKVALQDMFQGFVTGPSGGSNSSGKNDNKKLDLVRGIDYVLTHEDKDGDWMLVGDVPWEMFVTTVKSLRIMKGSDAIGLGERVSAKLKVQTNA